MKLNDCREGGICFVADKKDLQMERIITLYKLALLPVFLFLLTLPSGICASQSGSDTLYAVEMYEEQEAIKTVDSLNPAVALFGNHELPATTPFVMERRHKDQTAKYVTLWILFSILLLSIARFLFPLRFKETLMAAWESRYFHQIEREGGLLNNWVSFVLFLNYLLALSLLFYLSIPYLGLAPLTKNIHPAMILLYSLGIFTGFYLLKYLLMSFTAWVFKTSGPTESYFRNHVIINQFAGITILPLLVINYYNPISWILYATWLILFILALYKLIRVSLIGLRIADISAYHLILYLCTIEIAPVLFAIKLSSNLINS